MTATGLSTIYEVVCNASGAAEGGWQAVALDAHGNASFSVNLAQSGDYVRAVDNINAPAVTATSAAVAITDPAPTITLSDLGAAQETAPGAGVTLTESDTKLPAVNTADFQPMLVNLQAQMTSSTTIALSKHGLDSLSDQPLTTIDRFALSTAQEATFYESKAAVLYSVRPQGQDGSISSMLLSHLSKLDSEGDLISKIPFEHGHELAHLSGAYEHSNFASAALDAAKVGVSTNAIDQHPPVHHVDAHGVSFGFDHFG